MDEEILFKVGDIVQVKDKDQTGIIRFIGAVHFSSGVWVGMELPNPNGKNDGSVMGERYFTCQDLYGLFVKQNTCVSSNEVIPELKHSLEPTIPVPVVASSKSTPRSMFSSFKPLTSKFLSSSVKSSAKTTQVQPPQSKKSNLSSSSMSESSKVNSSASPRGVLGVASRGDSPRLSSGDTLLMLFADPRFTTEIETILSAKMEPELATRDAELQLLRSKVDALEIKAEYHKASYERIDNKLASLCIGIDTINNCKYFTSPSTSSDNSAGVTQEAKRLRIALLAVAKLAEAAKQASREERETFELRIKELEDRNQQSA